MMLSPEIQVPLRFAPGQLVRHSERNFRGVIYEVDERFRGPDHLLTDARGLRAPKDRPWYYILVDGTDQVVYVPERYLLLDLSGKPIRHPLLDNFFIGFFEGRYQRINH